MEDEGRSKLKNWFIGFLTGIGVAAPLTAFFVKKIYDKPAQSVTASQWKSGVDRGTVTNTTNAEGETQWVPIPTNIPNDDEYSVPSAEEINNYDLDIDDKEATERSQIPVEDIERLKDMIERYDGTLADVAYVIDAERFMDDHTNDKAYVNWYEKDNVFEEDLIVTKDPVKSFGTADGSDLFKSSGENDDPDTVYIRNNKQCTDYEITRIHGSYAEMVGGAKPIGQADSDM